MRRFVTALVGLSALLPVATAANATIFFDFNTPTGGLPVTQTYTSDGYNVTAAGYSSTKALHLYGKNGARPDDRGLGLLDKNDLTGKHEIIGTDYIQLDVSDLFGLTDASFFMGSVEAGEGWALYGTNTAGAAMGTLLLSGWDGGVYHSLPDFGQYTYYNFYAMGGGNANVLLGGLSAEIADVSAVPEPAAWAMMLLGFGVIGSAMRRRNRIFAPRRLA